MTYSTLKALLTPQDGALSVPATGFDTPSVQSLIRDFLPSGVLALTGATLTPNDAQQQLTLSGTLTEAFLQIDSATLQGVFTVDGATTTAYLVVKGLPSGWVPSHSFPSLKGSILDGCTYDAPHFELDSERGTVLPDDFNHQFGYPPELPAIAAALQDGLSFSATVGLGPDVKDELGLFVDAPVAMQGPIALYQGKPKLLLTTGGQGMKTIPLGSKKYSLDFGFQLAVLFQVFGPGTDPTLDSDSLGILPTAMAAVRAGFEAHGAIASVPVYALFYSTGLGLVQINGQPPKPLSIGSDLLPDFLNGTAVAHLIPSGHGFPGLDEIYIDEVGLSVSLAPLELRSIATVIEVGALGGWTLFGGLVHFSDLRIRFAVEDLPTTPQPSATLYANATVSDTTLAGLVEFPQLQFACDLETGTIEIGKIVDDILGQNSFMPTLTCTEFQVSGEITEGRYTFAAVVEENWTFHIGSVPLELEKIALKLSHTSGSPSVRAASASATHGSIYAAFAVASAELFVSAAYDSTQSGWVFEGGTNGNQTISLSEVLQDLEAKFGLPVTPGLPEVDLEALDVQFNTGTKEVLFGCTVAFPTAEVNLSDLPLIGDKLGIDETLALRDIQVQAGTGQGVTVTFDLQFGAGKVEPVVLTFGGSTSSGGDGSNGGDGSTTAVFLVGGDDAPSGGGGQTGSGATKWFDVQQTFGPVQFRRVGFGLSGAGIEAELDASLSLGGLELDLQGLSVTIPLTKPFIPTFGLQGLALTYKSGPVEISGGLLRVIEKTITEYNGELVIKAEPFTISALGSYGSLQGHPSLFVFGIYDEPIGGPSFFFVTGLAAGFGFNRSLAAPAQDKVQDFPLVAGLSDPAKLGITDPSGKPDLGAVLATLDQYVPPTLGESWLAAGVRFTTFDLINSSALVAVEFGKEFELLILGLSILKQPQDGKTYVYAELWLEVIVKPDEGIFQASAVLTPNSYVIDPACHLTGGFAFYTWFGGSPHAGQFVITLGGYYSGFPLPSYYPKEPRLGFNWAVSDTVTIDGGAYFALTPSAVMAGGALEILFHDGNLQAWFKAFADFFISWKPFHYEADIGVSIGVSYTFHVLGIKKTIRVELGADLSLWGPPMGGTAHVHLWIVSFSVSFGADKSASQTTVDWDAFAQLLPQQKAPAAQEAPLAAEGSDSAAPIVCHVAVSAGLLSQVQDDTAKRWIVRGDTFTFATQTNIPATEIAFLGATTAPTESDYFVGLRPVGVDAVTSSTHTVTLTATSGVMKGKTMPADAWNRAESVRDVPEAMWGKALHGKRPAPSAKTLPGRWMGLEGIRAVAPTPSGLPPIDVDGALSSVTLADSDTKDYLPLSTEAAPTGGTATPSATALQTIAQTVAAEATVAARTAVFNALNGLGYNPITNGSLTTLAADPGLAYAAEPLLGSPVAS